MSVEAQQLRARILDLVNEYYQVAFPAAEFVPGQSPVPVAGRVFDAAELRSLGKNLAREPTGFVNLPCVRLQLRLGKLPYAQQ